MARTIRTAQYATNWEAQQITGLSQSYSITTPKDRADWKALIARRDARRSAYRNAHPPIGRQQHGRASIGMLATLATALGSILAAISSAL